MKLPLPKPKKFTPIIKIMIIFIIILLVLISVYFVIDRAGFIKTYQLGLQAQEQQQLQNEDQMALENLKNIMLLPDDFDPTIAIINDAEALKLEQPGFFDNAKNGDRIIIYPNTAIIYDYEANKIINIGPVQMEPPAAPPEEEVNMEISQ